MQLILGGRAVDLRRRVLVMAIVNRTADSFYDGGRTLGLDAAVDHALAQVKAGADIIDVGAVKAGPGPEVSVDEEVERVVSFVEAFGARSPIPVSVDTYRATVARAGLAAGAAMINDVGGIEPEIAGVVAADADAGLVVVHTGGPPRTRPWRPVYRPDVVRAVAAALRAQVDEARARGVPAERIVVDPGHDLGKNTFHSLELCRRLAEIAALGHPVLVALSRKDFLGETLGGLPPGERLEGSLAAAVVAVLGGARILRVHDTEATVRAVRTVEAIQGWRRPDATARGPKQPSARTLSSPVGRKCPS